MKKKNVYAPDSYRTGDTQPPAARRWPMVLLMASLIFLVGLFTALSFLNIRIFDDAAPNTLAHAYPSPNHDPMRPDLYGGSVETIDPLGLTGQEISVFSRHYYNLPSGIYITAVSEQTAYLSSVFPGDILISIQYEYVTNHYQLMTLLEALWDAEDACWLTDVVTVEIYRQGRVHQVYIPLGDYL